MRCAAPLTPIFFRPRLLNFAAVLVLLMSGLMAGWAGAQETAARRLAEGLIQQAGMKRAVVSLLGRDAALPVELARASEWLIHVRDSDAQQIDELKQLAASAGLGIDRLVADHGSLEKLPYADNLIDVAIASQASGDWLQQVPVAEVLRCLRPEGVAIVGKAMQSDGPDVSLEQLKAWAAHDSATSLRGWQDESGTWVRFAKAEPEGIDEWTHWEKGPDNNPVSSDSVIKAPYMTQFMAGPMYIGMPSITTAAGGRTFLAIGQIAHHRREWDTLYKLIARNGYNGTVLWTRDLPEGYQVHRSAFIASKDTFYMLNGDHALMLDAKTGAEQGTIRIDGVSGEWKWMVKQGDVLYVLSGTPEPGTQITKGDRTFGGWSWADLSPGYYEKRIPFGFGKTLAAYDLAAKKLLWKHEERSVIDSRALSLRDGQLYLFCPDQHLRCLSAATGEVIWTNNDEQVRSLIEEPGKGLTSTPGFRTACLAVATPDAIIIQGQTRMNVVAVSTKDGYVLWTKRKITNNPNAIYVDGRVILGVGKRGSHVALDPKTGDEQEDLGFFKRACTRLTASGDSFFCRGEGTLRYDRESKKVLIDGAQRPACNDGAIAAHGLLYLGPWQCDCNLSLIGNVAKCSAGNFAFDRPADEGQQLYVAENADDVAAFDMTENDWPTLRGDNQRSSSTQVAIGGQARPAWQARTAQRFTPTAPVSAGNLVFVAGTHGQVRAFDARSGQLRWQFLTGGPIQFAPSIDRGRAYFGSADGYAYCVEAATGRLLWKFRAAPTERQIMVYGNLVSTWPVSSGVLVQDGVAYFAAGIIDHDGTQVYAVDAATGKLKWNNNSSGHLSEELRKGVSVQGNLSILGNQLLLAGGNQVSPAIFDIETGQCNARPMQQGQPKANNGSFVGVFRNVSAINGGRILYSAAENVSTKGYFSIFSDKRALKLNMGGIPPAWNDDLVAMVNFKHGKLTACDSDKLVDQMGAPQPAPNDRTARFRTLAETLETNNAIRWQTDLGESNKFEAISLAICPTAIVGVVKHQQRTRSQPQWFAAAFNIKTGRAMFRQELRGEPLPGGLLVDRDGRIVITMLNGDIICLATKS